MDARILGVVRRYVSLLRRRIMAKTTGLTRQTIYRIKDDAA
jgi:hypothetical protein